MDQANKWLNHWGKQVGLPDAYEVAEENIGDTQPKKVNEMNKAHAESIPSYGDITIPMSSDPYLRRQPEGVRTNLTAKKKTSQVQNKTYGVAR